MSGQRYRARRRAELPQHFLRSRALAASLVAQSSVGRQDLVVEIGPGRGVLTRELAGRCGRLVGVEIDGDLARRLRTELAQVPHVEIVQQDFLRFEFPASPFKVFGSIPYSRTADIVRRLVEATYPPEDAYLVAQLEAAERFSGAPYAAETLASLLAKPWWHVEIARWLRRTDFAPPPRVDSVLLWLARRTRPLVDESERRHYEEFVGSAFGRRGSTMHQCLRWAFTGRQIGRLTDNLRFERSAPPSTLSFEQWLGLFRFYMLERSHNYRKVV